MHIPGMCVCLWAGKIPNNNMEKCKDLSPSALNKENLRGAVDQLDAAIDDLQERTVLTVTLAMPSL